MALPQESKGLLVQNQLNLVQGTQHNGHYNLQLEGSWGQWTPFMEGDATWQEGQSSEVGLAQLYGERLHEANFYRLGFFFPSAQGCLSVSSTACSMSVHRLRRSLRLSAFLVFSSANSSFLSQRP